MLQTHGVTEQRVHKGSRDGIQIHRTPADMINVSINNTPLDHG